MGIAEIVALVVIFGGMAIAGIWHVVDMHKQDVQRRARLAKLHRSNQRLEQLAREEQERIMKHMEE